MPGFPVDIKLSAYMVIKFVLALAAGVTAAPEICVGVVRETVPDMQIREVDLDHTAAVAATERLRVMVDLGTVKGEYQYGALNQIKILHGHVLLQQAISDRISFGIRSAEAKYSTSSFCSWLAKDGFWYD